jgi:hypothetical protein
MGRAALVIIVVISIVIIAVAGPAAFNIFVIGAAGDAVMQRISVRIASLKRRFGCPRGGQAFRLPFLIFFSAPGKPLGCGRSRGASYRMT